MELDERKLARVPDGGVLHTTASGINILRRKKHEPIVSDDMPPEELAHRTDKKNGAKFLPGTTLSRIVEMTCEILEENEAALGSNLGYTKVYGEPVGISRGRRVRAVKVVRSTNGAYAHAYPEDEDRI
jgi:hypothetical protein